MGGGSEGDEEQDASSLESFRVFVFVFLYLVPETNYLNPGRYSPSRPSMRGGAVEGTGDDDDGDFNDDDDLDEDTNDDDDDDVICAITKHL